MGISSSSNLGAFTTTESRCVNPTTGALSNGLFTFNFANGSTFFGTDSGTITLPPVNGIAPFSLTFSITGGTGLFAGATGSLLGTGLVTFNQNSSARTLNFTGTVNTVPEPTTMLLLGTGLAGVGAMVRRRRTA